MIALKECDDVGDFERTHDSVADSAFLLSVLLYELQGKWMCDPDLIMICLPQLPTGLPSGVSA